MSTQTRLDAYLSAETSILEAQEVRGGDRQFRMAELQEVRAAIKDLQRQLSREAVSTARKSSLGFSLGNLNR